MLSIPSSNFWRGWQPHKLLQPQEVGLLPKGSMSSSKSQRPPFMIMRPRQVALTRSSAPSHRLSLPTQSRRVEESVMRRGYPNLRTRLLQAVRPGHKHQQDLRRRSRQETPLGRLAMCSTDLVETETRICVLIWRQDVIQRPPEEETTF